MWQASQDEGTIEKIEPRRNLFYRQDDIRTKSFAANLDQVLILLAAEPVFSSHQLSRALIAAEAARHHAADRAQQERPDRTIRPRLAEAGTVSGDGLPGAAGLAQNGGRQRAQHLAGTPRTQDQPGAGSVGRRQEHPDQHASFPGWTF